MLARDDESVAVSYWVRIRESNRVVVLDQSAARIEGAEGADTSQILDWSAECGRAPHRVFAQLIFDRQRVRVDGFLAGDSFQPSQHSAIVVLIRLERYSALFTPSSQVMPMKCFLDFVSAINAPTPSDTAASPIAAPTRR